MWRPKPGEYEGTLRALRLLRPWLLLVILIALMIFTVNMAQVMVDEKRAEQTEKCR